MKLFILTRRDLTASQRLVQSCHAVAELLKGGNPVGWNDTIVALGVKDEAHLRKWEVSLGDAKHSFATFCEPYFDDQTTSLAFVGTPPGLETDLDRLRLL